MVASRNKAPVHEVSSYVFEQSMALRKKGIEVDIFPINGKGFWGYFKAVLKLNILLKNKKFDIIHGHYILSAIITILQFKVNVVASFIGCDINVYKNRLLSRWTVFKRAKALIFVSEKLQKISGYKGQSYVIPYGVDINKYFPIDKQEAKKYLQWSENVKYIFFASRFDRVEKNVQLAYEAIEILKRMGIDCKLIEFKNIKDEELNYYYNASDLFLLTSIREGSPQSIKEALLCNCPIVATDVGDINDVIKDIAGCYITSFDSKDTADEIMNALEFSSKFGRTKGRDRILELGLDWDTIANRIIEVYKSILAVY